MCFWMGWLSRRTAILCAQSCDRPYAPEGGLLPFHVQACKHEGERLFTRRRKRNGPALAARPLATTARLGRTDMGLVRPTHSGGAPPSL